MLEISEIQPDKSTTNIDLRDQQQWFEFDIENTTSLMTMVLDEKLYSAKKVEPIELLKEEANEGDSDICATSSDDQDSDNSDQRPSRMPALKA